MQIEIQDANLTTDRCRYCLMCRHVCPVTHLTRNEATSPHGWGLLIASVRRGLMTWNEDTVDVLYQCADCGLCQAHCVTDQPLPLAINTSRAGVVHQQLAPPAVYDVQQKLAAWGNPYLEVPPETISGQAKAALIVGAIGHHFQSAAVTAALKLLAAAGLTAIPIAVGRESPYLAHSLGLPDEARQLGRATLAEIEQVGAKQVFVLSPGDLYAYQTLLGYLKLSWPDGVEIMEVTAYLAHRLEAGQLAFSSLSLSDYTFYDPDHSVRVSGRWAAPRKLLAALSQTPPIELFWRKERAAPCGAGGGLNFTQPELSARLAQARLAEAQERGIKTIITDAPEVVYHLCQHADGAEVEIRGLFELLAGQLIT
jgi:Fe-S oxidoreductase